MRLGVSFLTWAFPRTLMARTASESPDWSATWAFNVKTSCRIWVTTCSIVIIIPESSQSKVSCSAPHECSSCVSLHPDTAIRQTNTFQQFARSTKCLLSQAHQASCPPTTLRDEQRSPKLCAPDRHVIKQATSANVTTPRWQIWLFVVMCHGSFSWAIYAEHKLHLIKTEGLKATNCFCKNIVQCRVIVDNKCEFQHSSSHGDCNFDARPVSKPEKDQQTFVSEISSGWLSFTSCKVWDARNSSSLPTDSCLTNPVRRMRSTDSCPVHQVRRSDQLLVYEHSQVLRYVRNNRSVIALSWALQVVAKMRAVSVAHGLPVSSLSVMVQSSWGVLNSSTVPMVSLSFCTRFDVHHPFWQFVCFCTSDVGSIQQMCDPWDILLVSQQDIALNVSVEESRFREVRSTQSQGQMLREFSQICLGPNMKVSCTQDPNRVASSLFRLGRFLPFTNLSCSLSRGAHCFGVRVASIFIDDEWCVSQVWFSAQVLSSLNLRIPVFPCLSLCVSGFEKFVDVVEPILVWQTHDVVAVHCHPHIFVGVVEQGCTVFASSESSQLSTDQGHVVKLPHVGPRLEFHTFSWFICQLCLRHISDDLVLEVGCWWVSGLFFWNGARLMSWCLNFNGLPLFDQLTDIMIETNAFTASVVALQRTTEKQERLFESCLASSSCIPCHNLDRILWWAVSTDLSVHPDLLQQLLVCILTILHRDNVVETLRM